MKKLWLVAFTGLVLGGCTLPSWRQDAATDVQLQPTVNIEEKGQDPALVETPAISSDNEVDDLEKDIDNTEILDEDFADLEQ